MDEKYVFIWSNHISVLLGAMRIMISLKNEPKKNQQDILPSISFAYIAY